MGFFCLISTQESILMKYTGDINWPHPEASRKRPFRKNTVRQEVDFIIVVIKYKVFLAKPMTASVLSVRTLTSSCFSDKV